MTYNTGPKIVTDGLVLCLDAADRNSYPRTGTVWYDQSGNGSNGTLTNGPTFSSANGGGIVFGGTNDYVALDSSFQVSTSKSYCVDMVFYKTTTSTNNAGAIISGGSGGDTDGIIIYTENYALSGDYYIIVGNGTCSAIYYNGVSQTLVSNSYTEANFNLNEWMHVIVNGISFSNVDGEAHHLGQNNNATNRFGGRLAAIKIYDRTLSANEVLQNYNATKGRFGL